MLHYLDMISKTVASFKKKKKKKKSLSKQHYKVKFKNQPITKFLPLQKHADCSSELVHQTDAWQHLSQEFDPQ